MTMIKTILIFLLLVSFASAKPPEKSSSNVRSSGNMSNTTRYFGPSGHVGTVRTYESNSSKRSYYYNSKGTYQGQSVEKKK